MVKTVGHGNEIGIRIMKSGQKAKDGRKGPSLAFCPLFIMRIQSTLPWSAVSAICEFFKNDETEVKKCTLTENHMGQGFGNYGSARGSRRNSLRKK